MPPSLWWIKYVIFSHSSLLEAELKLLAYKYFEQSELALILNLKTWSLFLLMVLCILSCYLFIQRTYGKPTWRIKTLKLQGKREEFSHLSGCQPSRHPPPKWQSDILLLLRCPVTGIPTDITCNNYALSN